MNDDFRPTLPWWKVRTMWLVIGGPSAVVIAGFATLFIAVRSGDVPLRVQVEPRAQTMAPAAQARNHAATARP